MRTHGREIGETVSVTVSYGNRTELHGNRQSPEGTTIIFRS